MRLPHLYYGVAIYEGLRILGAITTSPSSLFLLKGNRTVHLALSAQTSFVTTRSRPRDCKGGSEQRDRQNLTDRSTPMVRGVTTSICVIAVSENG